jgi:hypothetical protein
MSLVLTISTPSSSYLMDAPILLATDLILYLIPNHSFLDSSIPAFYPLESAFLILSLSQKISYWKDLPEIREMVY